MKVQIEGNLYLESDPYNFMIREYVERKDGKEGPGKTITHGYFGQIKDAVRHVVKMKVKESTALTLLELVSDIQRIEQHINTQISI